MNTPDLLIELKPSRIHEDGIGVFSARFIKKGQTIATGLSVEDFKRQISWKAFATFHTTIKKKVMQFCVGTPRGFVPPADLDFNALSIEWYLNHSCDGNTGFDRNGDFVAIRDIARGEEIAYDYGLVESNPNFTMDCTCKTKRCRNTITGNDWKTLMYDKFNNKYMHPFLILSAWPVRNKTEARRTAGYKLAPGE